jgi:hypothetical protein
MNEYQVDTQIQLNGYFFNVLLNVPADPTTVSLFVEDPTGNVTEIASDLIFRVSTGVYYSLVLPSGPGVWKYKWQGVGNVQATSPDTCFLVKASSLVN